MTNRYYILGENKMLIPASQRGWKEWCDKINRVIRTDNIGRNFIRTQFVGLNMRLGDGPPLVYTTFMYGYDDEKYSNVYSESEEVALMNHALMASQLMNDLKTKI